MSEHNDDFLTAETEQKVAEFEAKLRAEQAAMPDTSIRSSGMGIDAPQNYYFGNENIPIYDSGTNKQIDRVDMEVDRARRHRNTIVADEVDRYMREIRQEIAMKEQNGGVLPEEKHHTAPFVYIVPGILAVFGIIVVVAMSL